MKGDKGQVTGSANFVGSGGESHAFVTDTSGHMTDLSALNGVGHSAGLGINSNGQVTGYHTVSATYSTDQAFMTDSFGHMTYLSGVGVLNSYGYGINSSGQVTGYFGSDKGSSIAFVSSGTTILDLNNLLSPNHSGWYLAAGFGGG